MKRLFALLFLVPFIQSGFSQTAMLKRGFLNPPNEAKPGVYWYFMDGNMSRSGITEDLEAMKAAGINNLIFLEVNVGVPRGKIDFLSPQWQELFKHAEKECERLNIRMVLGTGPGWAGSGGPWVKPSQSMQVLVSSSVNVTGGNIQAIRLPVPANKKPYFGESSLAGDLKKQWTDFYEDVAVLAFPTPAIEGKIPDADEKALYYRAPFSSVVGTKPFLPSVATYPAADANSVIPKTNVIDVTAKLSPDGTLNWKVPAGNWTIMRFGRRNNGAVTRPAPVPGLGFEANKMDTADMGAHLANYTGKLLKKVGPRNSKTFGGLKMLHIDSWEMGSQNWTEQFRQEFIKRRGYDPLPFYPVYAGNIVDSREMSERFLWDLRQTSQELVLENHAGYVKTYSHKNGMGLSIEPYDMNPTADLELGNIADEPMCEFWSEGYGYNTSFSVIEAASIAHINGKAALPAEAFTAENNEGWKQYPGSMKNEGDWAFAAGVNRFVFHTFAHQPLNDKLKPGMQMGPYGVHWDRNQTWWPMVNGYHSYVSSCEFMLQQGRTVADILYLTPEGAPHVFRAPASALKGTLTMPDRKGYNFDGCAPGQLYKAMVKDRRIVFPGGASYRLLVLPLVKTMTPALLQKIESLVKAGAIVVGLPPQKSPGLSGYPACDDEVKSMALTLWGNSPEQEHIYGKGRIIGVTNEQESKADNLYPEYEVTAAILKKMDIHADFESDANIRYTHRTAAGYDVYFVSNTGSEATKKECIFRSTKGKPELWNPITKKSRLLPQFTVRGGQTKVLLQFEPFESYFIVFKKDAVTTQTNQANFAGEKEVATLTGPWTVSFDAKWGGPANITFDQLQDWALSNNEGIKYYSGIATYKKQFDLPGGKLNKKLLIDLGEVKNLARVKLNGKNLGVVWTAPWSVDITNAVKAKGNVLEIEVANLWPNRLIGDENFPNDGIKDGQFPDWLLQGKPRPTGRFAFSTFKPYKKTSPLLSSGLLGPVTIKAADF